MSVGPLGGEALKKRTATAPEGRGGVGGVATTMGSRPNVGACRLFKYPRRLECISTLCPTAGDGGRDGDGH